MKVWTVTRIKTRQGFAITLIGFGKQMVSASNA